MVIFKQSFPIYLEKWGGVEYKRERIQTEDNDFLDLDYLGEDSESLVLLSHGLEGSSRQQYMLGMANYFVKRGWKALAWNYRSCGGSINLRSRFYHSGDTSDLKAVIEHVLKQKKYKRVALVGFSLGGNVTLKYLGEEGTNLPPEIVGGVTFSVPCHLASGAVELAKPKNKLYESNFLLTLKKKVFDKKRKGLLKKISLKKVLFAKTLWKYDDIVTAPLHGFKNADDYYDKSSSINFLEGIKVPTLLVNAKNDPMLASQSYPTELAKKHGHFHFESPKTGGHVGFLDMNLKNEIWSERRAWQFISSEC